MTGTGGINVMTSNISGYAIDKSLPAGVLEDNTTIGSVIPEPGYFTTLSATETASFTGNIYSNNIFTNSASTVSAAGTTVLTVASARNQVLTGSSNQTYQLPDATTLIASAVFTFNNNSSGSLVITNAGGSTLYTAPAGGYVLCIVTAVTTTNGTWDFHPQPPTTVTWGSGTTGFVMNTALSTTPSVSAGASSSTAPSFIPQRASATTGFGGDSTNLYMTIGGASIFSASAIATAQTVGNALTSAGTSRTDALQLAKQINNITTAALNTGVILPVGVIGNRITVFNAGANPVKVYASASETIDGTAGATGVTLTNAKRCDFFFVAANTWISAQLGVVSA